MPFAWMLRSGGRETIESYRSLGQQTRASHIAFFEALENYYLDPANRLYLHAGFTNPKGIEHEYFSASFYWDRTLWETALALDPSLGVTGTIGSSLFSLACSRAIRM